MTQLTVQGPGPSGRTFNVVVVPPGGAYGRGGVLTNDSSEPLVEFWDATHADSRGFGPLGQFVSRYYLSTLAASDLSYGLDLDGGVAVWKVEPISLAAALESLIAEWGVVSWVGLDSL